MIAISEAAAEIIPESAVKSIMQVGTTREPRARNVRDAAVHSAGEVAAANMAAAKATVTGETSAVTSAKAGMSATRTGVPAPTLRPHRYREEDRERRNAEQAAHTGVL